MPMLVSVCPVHGAQAAYELGRGDRGEVLCAAGHEVLEPRSVPVWTEAEVRLIVASAVARVKQAERDSVDDLQRFDAKAALKIVNEVVAEAVADAGR